MKLPPAHRQSIVSDPKASAEVCYSLPDGTLWEARVYKRAPDDGRPIGCWELRLGPKKTLAGTFVNGKALIKFIRQKAEEKLGRDATPVFDTLHKIKNRDGRSVVPDCYNPMQDEASDHEGRGFPECVACPYRSQCGEPSAHPKTIPAEDVKEPEEVFLARLKAKIKARYGGS